MLVAVTLISCDESLRASNWVGEQECTELVRSRHNPDGSVQQLAALPRNVLDTPVPFALAQSGQRLIVVGRKPVPDDHEKDAWNWIPTAWESTDGGVTLHETPC